MLNDGEVWIDLESRGRRVRCDAVYQGDDPSKICVGEYVECGIKSSHGMCPFHAKEHTTRTGRPEPKDSIRKREQTMRRLKEIENDDRVEKVTYIWSCQFQHQKKRDPEVAAHCATFRAFADRTPDTFHSTQDIIDAVLCGDLEGFVLCKLGTAKEGRAARDFFPQFFTHKELEPLGPIKKRLDGMGLVLKPRKQIVSSHTHYGWHHTSAIKFHVKQLGQWFQMYDVVAILESRLEKVFKNTVDKLAALRLKYTLENKPVMAMAIKGVSNTSYGSTIRKMMDLRRILICSEKATLNFRCKNTYIDSTPLFDQIDDDGKLPKSRQARQKKQEDYYEVTLTTKQQTMKLPFLVGVTVLSLSKLAFNELVMDFMDRFYRTGSWQPCYVNQIRLKKCCTNYTYYIQIVSAGVRMRYTM